MVSVGAKLWTFGTFSLQGSFTDPSQGVGGKEDKTGSTKTV